MIHAISRNTVCILLSALVMASCATTRAPVVVSPENDIAMIDASWQAAHTTHPAVSDLLQQADDLLAADQPQQAADKVERALRIEPGHAPSWSRLARIALDSGQPRRAIRMARKSNSHAGDAGRLKLQNWEYIREANVRLNNRQGVDAAVEQILQLQGAL